MNLILLSGGGGKRLWPISNDVHSKQFIKLFKNDKGFYESMIQRIYRQIMEVEPNTNVTIATSELQSSSIYNQLGKGVTVCVEPSRRDTFPAIVLAASYLHYELGISLNECIVVTPVDHFVDNSYFEYLNKLVKIVEQDTANLTLLGIEPTYPSENYGYIIPDSLEELAKVIEFKEKPNVETAEKYLLQNALWNAGVFGFKIGYIIEKAKQIIEFADYKDLYANYNNLRKISFDYAVTEKESSIQVLRYKGQWKDIGTWNTITGVMDENIKGEVILDNTSNNVSVINELNIPMLLMGCKDLIIAASRQGILISEKNCSEYIKPFVETIDNKPMFAEKTWGNYLIIDKQKNSKITRITINSGESTTLNKSKYRKSWTIISGTGRIIVNETQQSLRAGDVIKINEDSKVTIICDSQLSLLEVELIKENIS